MSDTDQIPHCLRCGRAGHLYAAHCDSCGHLIRSERQLERYAALGVDWALCVRCAKQSASATA